MAFSTKSVIGFDKNSWQNVPSLFRFRRKIPVRSFPVSMSLLPKRTSKSPSLLPVFWPFLGGSCYEKRSSWRLSIRDLYGCLAHHRDHRIENGRFKRSKEEELWSCQTSSNFYQHFFWGLLTQGRSIFFRKWTLLSFFPKGCVPSFFVFQPQKTREFFSICFHMRKAKRPPPLNNLVSGCVQHAGRKLKMYQWRCHRACIRPSLSSSSHSSPYRYRIANPENTLQAFFPSRFEAETPRMSSYLLGFAIGDFSVLHLESKSPVPMALYAQRGQVWMEFSSRKSLPGVDTYLELQTEISWVVCINVKDRCF